MKAKIAVGVLLFAVPAVALAAPTTFAGLVDFIISLINPLAAILSAVAVLIFFWGIVKYIASGGDEHAHEEGRTLMMWGVVALFVLFSVWGLARILASSFLGAGLAS